MRGRVSHRQISLIQSEPQPSVTAQGRIRNRMPIILVMLDIRRGIGETRIKQGGPEMRKILLLAAPLIILAVVFPLSTQPAKADITSGLVAHWPFDDGMVSTEEVVNGNDGVLFGDTNFVIQDLTGTLNDIAPIFGNRDAVDFLGDGDDYVEIPDDPTLDLGDSFTVAAWVNVDNTIGTNPIVSKEIGTISETNYNLQVTGTRAQLAFAWDAAASLNAPTLGTTSCDNLPGGIVSCNVTTVQDVVSANTWHHIAAVYKNSTKTTTIYVDGVKPGLFTRRCECGGERRLTC